jgi:hypothetical protein
MTQDVAIYGLADPRAPKKIRYIGATTQKLETVLHGHVMLSGDGRPGNPRVDWILALRAAGLKPVMVVLEKCSARSYDARKQFWMDAHQATVLNLARGGSENAWSIRAAVRDRAKVTAI